jgi:glutamate-1-semialdehyde 2,1-aminomutase
VRTPARNDPGHPAPVLAPGGSGLATLGIPSSPGVPAPVVERTLVARYNDVEGAAALVEASGVELAAIIVEPVGANMGVVPPQPGFLEGLRALADRLGAVLVFDEVITGFRVGWGGAQERYGVRADLTTFGKVIGGGMPVGAFGGRADLMDLVAPLGSVYQAGTLSGNPAAMAAGLAQLRALQSRDAFAQLDALGARLADGLRAVIARTGARADVAQVGSLVTLFQLPEAGLDRAPRDMVEAALLDTTRYGEVHAGALARGHYLAPSQYEAMFCSTAHSTDDVDAVVAALEAAMGTA